MKRFLVIFALTIVAITSNAQTSPKGDLDNDGVVSVSDVMELVKIILYGDTPPSYLTCPDDHHPHMIDLGLPSGTKWACCNEGASKPEDFGGYYQFGEVSSAPSLDQIKELVNNALTHGRHSMVSEVDGSQGQTVAPFSFPLLVASCFSISTTSAPAAATGLPRRRKTMTSPTT